MCGCDPEPKDPKLGLKHASERSITDPLMFLAFLGLWIAVIAILISCDEMGANPNKIIRGVDINGSICGESESVKDMPYAAWIAPTQYYSIKVCTNTCVITQTDPRFDPNYDSELFLYYCIPTTDLNGTSISLTGFDSVSETASRAFGDLYTSWPSFFLVIPIAIAMSFVYVKFVEKCGGCMVWTIIALVIVGGFLAGYVLLQAASDANDSVSESRAKGMEALGWIFVVLTVVFVCVIFFLRNRIKIALEVLAEASRALEELPTVVFFPMVPLIFACAYFAFWIVGSLYIFSVSDTVINPMPTELIPLLGQTNYTTYSWNDNLKDSFAVYFFHMLWNVHFWIYFCYMVIAGTIADWYFTLRDSSGDRKRGPGQMELGPSPVKESCMRTARYHLGTVAFGALIIAIIEWLRAFVKYIEEHTKAKSNKLQECIFCMIKCCLWCAECCLDKISKNAFVWTAIYGDSFVPAACSSFALIWANLARLAAINLVSSSLLNIGKLIVALMSTGIYGFIINAWYGDDVSSIALPCFIMFLLAFLIASLFMVTFDTTIDTLFLSFLIDEKFNKQSGQMFAPPSLCQLVETYAEQSKQHANEKKAGSVQAGSADYRPLHE